MVVVDGLAREELLDIQAQVFHAIADLLAPILDLGKLRDEILEAGVHLINLILHLFVVV